MTPADAYDVHLYGTRIARVTRGTSRARVGGLRWEWADGAVNRWGHGSRVVAHRLPLGEQSNATSPRATSFVDGLLPEGELRVHRAMRLGVDPDDTFGLLGRIGLDTAGALLVTEAGVVPGPPNSGPGEAVDAEGIKALLRDAGSGVYRGTLTSISLAGLIPKIGLTRDTEGTWRLPAVGQASTWIVKQAHPADSRSADVIDTEAAGLDLGRRCGVTSVEAEVLDLGTTRALAVSRYDRTTDGFRVHQEDLAQVFGLNTADPTRKFQMGRVIPSWRAAAAALRTGGGLLSPLARLVAFSYLVGNTDHHAKNTSLMRYDDGSVRVAPAYDIAMHLHHPGPHAFALDVAGARAAADVTVFDVVAEIQSWGVSADRARAAVLDVALDLRQALDHVDRTRHPGVGATAWGVVEQRVTTGIAALES